MSWLLPLFTLLQGFILFGLLYHYLLLLAGAPTPRLDADARPEDRPPRFALAIPAHDEAAVIAQTVQQLKNQDYPRERYDVFVVADHCSDDTAAIARDAGATCYERHDEPRGRKGYALAWLLDRIMAHENRYDAVVIFDADSQVDPAFLREMTRGLQSGAQVLQGQHVIANSDDNIFNQLAEIDMRLNNRLRNASRHNMGSAARLMGDAMCFSRQVLEEYPWSTFSLAEDMEYGIHLLRQGINIAYAPEARSYGQAAGGWKEAETQRVRWAGGLFDLRRRLGLTLLGEGLQQRRLALVDRGLELVLPPFSILAILSVALATLHALIPGLRQHRSLWTSFLTVAGWVAFPVVGLIIDRAPLRLFLAMVYGPFYVLWRIWIGVTAVLRGKGIQWVRTRRAEE